MAITNCAFAANQGLFGGAVYALAANMLDLRTIQVTNSTIVDNIAGTGGGVLIDEFNVLTFRNSIIRANTPNQIGSMSRVLVQRAVGTPLTQLQVQLAGAEVALAMTLNAKSSAMRIIMTNLLKLGRHLRLGSRV